MSSLITIDPGLTGIGVACWESGELTEACIVVDDGYYGISLTRRLLRIADLSYDMMVAHKSKKLVIECPQTYGGRAARGDANDLIALAQLVGGITVLFGRDIDVQQVTPSEWKGSAPKHVTEARAREKLSGEEKLRIEIPRSKKQQTDLWDAIGIGLWAFRR